jgi:hypothetical protein
VRDKCCRDILVRVDRFGRILAYWATVYFGQCFESHRSFLVTFFHGTRYVLICTKNGLGYYLGDSFSNSSGHPDLGSNKCFVRNRRFDLRLSVTFEAMLDASVT